MKYLFYIAKTYSIPIVQPLIKELRRQDKQFCIFASEIVKQNLPEDWDRSRILNSVSAARKYKPDFVLCPGNFVDFRIPGVKVQLFHGLGVEKPVHYRIRHFFDLYLTSGPYVTERFLKLKDQHKYFDIIETGWPKIDYILQYPIEGLRKELDLPRDKKIILYAPTFSTNMESASKLLDIIPKIIKPDEYWLFKFHELMDEGVVSGFRQINPENSKVLQIMDITPYLHAADVMISDTSSVIYEFMVLDKPIITFKTQDRKDKGIDINQPEELRPAIDRSLKNPAELSHSRQKHVAEINPDVSGKISKKIISELEKLDRSVYPRPEKPLNLFRKSQLIFHSIFRKGYLR